MSDCISRSSWLTPSCMSICFPPPLSSSAPCLVLSAQRGRRAAPLFTLASEEAAALHGRRAAPFFTLTSEESAVSSLYAPFLLA